MASITFNVSGVSATVAAGSEVVPVNFGYGWGSPPWGGAPPADPTIGWGAYPPAFVSSLQAISSLGTVSVTGTALVVETGLRGLTRLGNETVITAQSTSFGVGGLESIVSLSDVSVVNAILVSVSGVSSTTVLGNEVVIASARVIPSSVVATAAVNQIVFKSTSVIVVSGVGATVTVADLIVSASSTVLAQQITSNVLTNAAAALAGAITEVTELVVTTTLSSVTVVGKAVIIPSSISGTTFLGAVVAKAGAIPTITAVSATGQLGTLTSVTGKAVVVPLGAEGVSDVKTVSVLAGSGISVAVQSVVTVCSVSSVSVTGLSNYVSSGLTSSINVGEEFISAGAVSPILGIELVSGLGTAQIAAGSVVNISSGLLALSNVGDVSFSLGSAFPISGVQANFVTSNVLVTAPFSTSVQGFQLVSGLGNETAYTSILQRVFNVVATVILGTSVAKANSSSLINGLQLSGVVADVVSFIGKANVVPTGVEAIASVNKVGITAGEGVSVSAGSFALQASVGLTTVSTRAIFQVSGVSATALSGDEFVSGDAVVLIGAGSSAFQEYLLAFQGLNYAFQQGAAVSGMTGYVGTVAVLNTVNYVPIGLQIQSSIGSVTVSNSVVNAISGLALQGYIGSTSVTSSTAFRADTVQAFLTLSSVSVTGVATTSVSGVLGSSILSNVLVNPAVVFTVSGVEASTTLDSDSTVIGKATVYSSSVAADFILGSVSTLIQDNVFVSVDGVFSSLHAGTVSVYGNAVTPVVGLSANTVLAEVTVYASSITPVQGLSLVTELGTAQAFMGNTVRILGGVESYIYLSEVEVTSEQPTVIVQGVSGVFNLGEISYANTISGVSCVGYVGELQIWTNVNDEQDCNWANIPKGACNPWLPVSTPCGPQTLEVYGVEGLVVVGEVVVLSGIIFSISGVFAEIFLGDIFIVPTTIVEIHDPFDELEARGEIGFVSISIVEPQFVVVRPTSLRIRALLGNETIVTASSTTVRVSGEEADAIIGDVSINVGQVISIQTGLQARTRLNDVIILAYGGWGIPRWGGDSEPPTGWGDQGLAA